jgi:hypothetical protein
MKVYLGGHTAAEHHAMPCHAEMMCADTPCHLLVYFMMGNVIDPASFGRPRGPCSRTQCAARATS